MRNQKKRNPVVGLLILLVIIGVLAFFGFKGYVDSFSEPVDPDASVKAFVVRKGESGESVAQRLESEGFIRSSLAFKAVLKSRDNPTIQAGDFKISGALSLDEIIDNLTTKGPVDRWVTLLEGWRVEEVAHKLNKDLGIKQADFLKVAKEGYMFPDTYLFNPEASAQTIASTLENTFNSRFDSALQAKIRAQGLTVEQGVIMASLVEREARSDEVRTQVASIILKRFKMGMKLDIDATVRYAMDTQLYKSGKDFKYWQSITRDDYTGVISPYNTYLNNGLPPAPICNPSLSSLKAVANADPSTPYLYYFHDSKGNSYYGRTLDEHNANVANYR